MSIFKPKTEQQKLDIALEELRQELLSEIKMVEQSIPVLPNPYDDSNLRIALSDLKESLKNYTELTAFKASVKAIYSSINAIPDYKPELIKLESLIKAIEIPIITHLASKSYVDNKITSLDTNLRHEIRKLEDNSGSGQSISVIRSRWGGITGDISTQTDLQNALNNKQNILYETVSKNLNSYDYSITYTGSDIDYITYDLGGGLSIIKTFNYTGSDLTSIVLSGDTPSGIDLTKTLSYTAGNLTGVSYA